MPVTLANMAAKEAALTITWGDETLNIVYLPGKLKDATIRQIDQGLAPLNEVLASVIKSWDLLEEENGAMFPLEAARLEELPFPFKLQVAYAIARDIRPN